MSKKKANTCYVVNEIKNSVTFYLLNYLTNPNNNQVFYKSRLSHELLKMLHKDVNTTLFIDITSCDDDLSFIFNEFMNYFDVWFPHRISIINRNL